MLAACLLSAVGCGYIALSGIALIAGGGSDGGGATTTVDAGTSSGAEITALPRASAAPVQVVRVRVSDAGSRPVALRLEYALPASGTASPALAEGGSTAPQAAIGPFAPATLLRVLDGASQVVLAGPVTQTGALETAPDPGLDYTLEWDLSGALGAPARAGVALRLVLRDPASGVESNAFTALDQKIGNQPPAIDRVAFTPGPSPIVVTYRISDSTGDRCKVDAFFRRDGGARTALTPADPAELSSVEAAPSPGERAFLWNAGAEPSLAGGAALVAIELVPVDDGLLQGAPATSTAALVALDAPSEARIASVPSRAAGGSASVAFDLLDADDPSALVAARYEILSGPPSLAGTVSGTASPVSGPLAAVYAASPSGTRGVFVWDTARDLGTGPARLVALTIVPQGEGAIAARTPVFVAGNAPPVVAFAAPLPASATGEVEVALDIADDGPDPVEASLAYSSGAGFLPATLAEAAAPLASGPPGAPARHVLRWRSEVDLPLAAGTVVTLRASARDGLPGGDGAFAVTSTSIANAVPRAPSLTAVVPPAGRLAGGATVTLVGAGFVPGATTATIGGKPLGALAVLGGAALTGTLPSSTFAGAVDVVVTTAHGSASLAGGFRYQDAPAITSASPAEGPLAGGVALEVRGANLDGASLAVTLGGRAVTDAAAVDAMRITGTVPSATAAGLASLEVTTADGGALLAGAFRYLAAPSVTAVSPSSGPVAGGAFVEVTGAGFLSSATGVAFGGAPALEATVLSDGRIRARVPAAADPRAVDVTVTTPGGARSLVAAFTYLAAPQVLALSPRFGRAQGGDAVRITGAGFPLGGGAPRVEIGGVTCTGVSVVSATALDATAPALPPGQHDVAVTTAGGTGTRAQSWQSVGALTVTALVPASSPLGGGAAVVLLGGGFVDGATSVSLGARPLGDVAVLDGGTLLGTAPAAVPAVAGAVDVVVTTPLASTRVAAAFSYVEGPALLAIEPPEGPIGVSTTVTVRGGGFAAGAEVRVGGALLLGQAVLSSSTITGRVAAPSGAGVLPVLAATPAGSAALAGGFRALAPPAALEVAPRAGPLAGGFDVDIRGSGLLSATRTALLGGAPLESVRVLSDGVLRARVPATATAGFQAVFLETAGGRATVPGLYEAVAAPTISSVTGGPGPTTGGTPITISGSGFRAGDTRVTLQGVPVASAAVASPSRIDAVTPPGFAGAAALSVSTVGGSATLAAAFTYEPPAGGGGPASVAISSVVPAEGPCAGDTLVTIVGAGFDAGATAAIGGRPLRDVTVVGSTVLRGLTSPGPIGPQAVSVSAALGGASAAAAFRYAPAFTFAAVEARRVEDRAGTIAIGVALVTDGAPLATTVSVDVVDVTPAGATTSATSGTDYAPFARRSLVFPANTLLPQSVQVSILPDGVPEPEERIRLALVSPSASVLVAPIGAIEVALTDDDAEVVTLTAAAKGAYVGQDLGLSWTLAGSGLPELVLDPGALDVTGLGATALPPFEEPPALSLPPAVFTLRTGAAIDRGGPLRLAGARLVAEGSTLAQLGGVSVLAAAAADGGGTVIAGTIFLDASLAGQAQVTFDPLGPAPATELISTTQPDGFVLRLEADGRLRWVRRFGAAGVNDLARGVTSFPDGDVLMVGTIGSGSVAFGAGEPRATTLTASGQLAIAARYARDGSLRWARRLGVQSAGTTTCTHVGGYPDGSAVAVVGRGSGASIVFGPGEAVPASLTAAAAVSFVRLTSAGAVVWAKDVLGAGASKVSTAFCAAPDGGFFTGGQISGLTAGQIVEFGRGEPHGVSLPAEGVNEAWLARYRADGTVVWATLLQGAGNNGNETIDSVVALPDGGVAASISGLGSSHFSSAPSVTITGARAIARLDGAGALTWVRGPGVSAPGVAALAGGDIAVGGALAGTTTLGPGEPGERTLSSTSFNDAVYARFAPDDGRLVDAALVGTSTALAGGSLDEQARAPIPREDGGLDLVITSARASALRVGVDGVSTTAFTSPSENRNRVVLARALPALERSVAAAPRGGAWLVGGRSPSDGFSAASCVAPAPDGGAYAGGYFGGGMVFGPGEPGEVQMTADPTLLAAFVQRLRPDGTTAWVVAGAAGDSHVEVVAAVPLSDGGLVVGGLHESSVGGSFGGATLPPTSGSREAFVARITAAGAVEWLVPCGGDDDEMSVALAALPDDGVYVACGSRSGAAGLAGTSVGGAGAIFGRLRPDGTAVFAARLGDANTIPASVAVSASGNAVVSGSFIGSATFSTGAGTITITDPGGAGAEQAFVARLRNDDGRALAARALLGTRAGIVSAAGLPDGGVGVVGFFEGTLAATDGQPSLSAGTGLGLFVASIDGGFAVRWSRAVGSFSGATIEPLGLARMSSGDLAVVGDFTGTVLFGVNEPGAIGLGSFGSGITDGFLARYDGRTGALRGAQKLGGVAGEDAALGIAVGLDGTVYVAGSQGGGLLASPGEPRVLALPDAPTEDGVLTHFVYKRYDDGGAP